MAEVTFGEWLKRQRKAAGLTQEQLAQQLNCSTITLRKIEAEERRPSAQIVERLAKIFNISPNDQTAFLGFARGDWRSAPIEMIEDAPWRVSTKSPRSNLPATVTSLIGREQEIAFVREYFLNPDIRLVTLIGPPGIGKTRLSLEVAREELSDFHDGIFFVALAPLEDSSLVGPTIAQTLGFVETPNQSPLKRLENGIGDKQMLVVLDNVEHLIEGTATLVANLLSACPRLKILTTSREALRVLGEWVYPVPALNIPVTSQLKSLEIGEISQYAALTLFAERARAVKPEFVLNIDNLQSVATICAQLDGLPLAIELIAARIRLLSPQTLLERLSDQFTLYADGVRAVSARQKTLYGAIAWSYDLLSTEEQNFFARLSVFSGGFTLAAAESIFSRTVTDKSVDDLLVSLLDKGLLQRAFDTRGEPRFIMLVTIKQFALNCLQHRGEEMEVRNWHLAYFLDIAERAESGLKGPAQAECLARLKTEIDNLRAALEQASKTDLEVGLYIWRRLEDFWETIDIHEGLRWAAEFVQKLDSKDYPRVTYLWARVRLGYFALHAGNLVEAHDIFAEAVQEFLKDRNEIGVVFALEGVAGLFVAIGKLKKAAGLIGSADMSREKISDPRPLMEQAQVDKIMAACVAKMGQAAFSDAYDEGHKMTLDKAVTFALEDQDC